MKGASVKAILSFFSSHGLYFHHAKNQPVLRPPSSFSEHLPLFWPYLFSKKFYETFLVQNLGHNHLKKCNICCLGGLLKEKRESTSDLFSTFQKPYWPSCPIVHWLRGWPIVSDLGDNSDHPDQKNVKMVMSRHLHCCKVFLAGVCNVRRGLRNWCSVRKVIVHSSDVCPQGKGPEKKFFTDKIVVGWLSRVLLI